MNKKVAAPGLENRVCADHATPLYPQKLALTSPTGGGRSVGIVRSRTKATEFIIITLLIDRCVLMVIIMLKYYGFKDNGDANGVEGDNHYIYKTAA